MQVMSLLQIFCSLRLWASVRVGEVPSYPRTDGYRVSIWHWKSVGRAGARVAGRAGYKRKMAAVEAMVNKAKGSHCQAARAVELTY